MNLLAIDTSSLACTVGMVVNGRIFTRHEEQDRAHTRLLLPMIRSICAEAGLEVRDLDALVLGNGPGSFIGLRIAASVTAGLAFAAKLPVVPISSMAAVAADVGTAGDIVVVAQDAHMREVYLGLYKRTDGGLVCPVMPERLQPQCEIAELRDRTCVAAGFGWHRYPDLLAANKLLLGGVSDRLYPTAGALLRLGAADFEAGKHIRPQDIVPAYLRDTVAQRPG